MVLWENMFAFLASTQRLVFTSLEARVAERNGHRGIECRGGVGVLRAPREGWREHANIDVWLAEERERRRERKTSKEISPRSGPVTTSRWRLIVQCRDSPDFVISGIVWPTMRKSAPEKVKKPKGVFSNQNSTSSHKRQRGCVSVWV